MSRVRSDEAGSALVIALLFLSLFGLWLSATLSSARSAMKITETLRDQRPLVYDVDGAVEQAIQLIRGDSNKGKEGDSCDSKLNATDLNGLDVWVKCIPQAGSGRIGVGGSSPTLGVLTLAIGSEDGYQQESNSTIRINGGLYSNSGLTTWGGNDSRLNACPPSYPSACSVHDAYGTVTAVGHCSTSNIIAEILNCDASPTPAGSDPNYPADQNNFTAVTPVPARTTVCPSGSALVLLSPGWYNDAAGLSALTSGSCSHSLLWFQPGTYYFDFKDNPTRTTPPPTPCSTAPTCTWTINDQTITVVGGANMWPTRSFTDSSTGAGGTVLTSVTGQAAFTAADAGRPVYATGIPADTKIASVDAKANPPTATINRATTQTLTGQSVTIASLPADRGSVTVPGTCNADTLNNHPGVELIFGGLSQLDVHQGKMELCAPVSLLNQQIALYGVKADDGVLKAQTGCVTTVGFVKTPDSATPDSGHCAMVTTGGNKAWLVVNGTFYAPKAVLDLQMNNVTYQMVTRGVIARVLNIRVTPSSTFGGAFISSPGLGSLTASDREVFFTACTQAACGSPGSVTKLRALVDFHDSPTAGATMIVRSWSVVR